MLTRAGERAASLAANDEAQHYFERAAELAKSRRRGRAARAGRPDGAGIGTGRAGAGAPRTGARALRGAGDDASGGPGVGEPRRGRMAAGHGSKRRSSGWSGRSRCSPRRARRRPGHAGRRARPARLLQGRGRARRASGSNRDRDRRIALAARGTLAGAEHPGPDRRLARALRAVARALSSTRCALALENDLSAAALRAYNNLGDLLDRRDRDEEAIAYAQGLALARKAGTGAGSGSSWGSSPSTRRRVGHWSESLDLVAQVPQEQGGAAHAPLQLSAATTLPLASSRSPAAAAMPPGRGGSLPGCLPGRALWTSRTGRPMGAEGEGAPRRGPLRGGARRGAEEAGRAAGSTDMPVKVALGECLESALALGRLEPVEEMLARIEAIPPGKRPPLARTGGEVPGAVATARGEDERVEQWLKTAGCGVPRARPGLLHRGDPARARRVARRAGQRRGGRAAARGGARDLRAPRGGALDRACAAIGVGEPVSA